MGQWGLVRGYCVHAHKRNSELSLTVSWFGSCFVILPFLILCLFARCMGSVRGAGRQHRAGVSVLAQGESPEQAGARNGNHHVHGLSGLDVGAAEGQFVS